MKLGNRRGEIVVLIETVVVAFLIIGFLLAIKYNTQPTRPDVYPVTTPTNSPATPTTASSLSYAPVKNTLLVASDGSGFKSGATAQYVIDYSDHGFWPSFVEIKSQTRVVLFKNSSSHGMWIIADASAHNDPSAFNQSLLVEKGGEYRVTLPATPMTYHYRNYLNYSDAGIIIVR